MTDRRTALARLPRVDALVDASGDLVARYGRGPVTDAVRRTLEVARARLLSGDTEAGGIDELLAAAVAELSANRPGPPRPVINATGVIVHTNLGRAPLSAAAVEATVAAAGACDLELDLATGERGSRDTRLDPLLREATGAEAGIAVNNCAGALVLALAALAGGRQVPVARGELIEIGGEFRLPEIMAASGARLVEVGTTNRTRAADYHAGDDVALLLKVHPSNYRIEGFAESPPLRELATVARDRSVPLVYDIGSGLLDDRREPWLRGEPSARAALQQGADLVLCSGDKLLGGPQAGLVVGRADLVNACRRHPLARALRLDKLRIAALVVTLEAHLRGTPADLPVWAMLEADPDALAQRAAALADRVGGDVSEAMSVVGGGAAPGQEIPSPVVRIACADVDEVAARLRAGTPGVIARVEGDRIVVDLRTVPPDADVALAARLADALT